MIRKILPVLLALVLCVPMFACEPPSDATIAAVIESASGVAFTQILNNNEELLPTFRVYALLNKQIIEERTINAELANKMLQDVLMQCKDLDPDDVNLVLTLFNTILPLIQLPEEGVLEERQELFMLAFLNGMITACDNKLATMDPPSPPPVSWEVESWFLKEILNGLHGTS
jgi:hypothetical protein